MDYFEFFEIPVSFFPDITDLKQRFLQNSKRFHPDYFTLESDEKQGQALELSTFNNEAYQTLADFDRRIKYILDLHGILKEEGKNEIPQEFLLEMMDINEAIMELEFDFDQATFDAAKKQVAELETSLFEEVKTTLENYRNETAQPGVLEPVREFFFKRRYLLRIKENLDRFAPASTEAH